MRHSFALAMADELFTFVLDAEVEPTNNRSERQLHGAALDRKVGRTSKTAAGAQRRSVIVSGLESLRANLEKFNLATVLEEVGRWMSEGISLFAEQVAEKESVSCARLAKKRRG
jgi:hypothetical protein